ncbi:MAG: hypothetical protein KJO52_11485 [Maribacter sp.]|nr:hypothetical protein [Maribacter sp.]NNK18081.1 hypothetical protein [Maribacter sp.]
MIKAKNFLFNLLLISALVFSSYSCNEQGKKPQTEDQPIIKAPDNIISLGQADSIYNNYSKHRVSVIEGYEMKERAPEENFKASRFVDFDYQMLKDYIAYVDQEAKNAGVQKVKTMRLYFANYPNKDNFPDGKKVIHKRQNSIFMLPTLDKGGENYGFYVGADGKAKLIIDWKTQNNKGMGFNEEPINKSYAGFIPNNFALNSNLQGGKSLTLNYGGSGPPPKTDF